MVSTTAKTELVVRRREAEVLATKLRHGEARYRALSGALDDGFCLMEMIADAHGTFVDYRFLEVNDAFVRHTGLVDPVGKTARELVPDLDESWFRLYGAVALTGEPVRFENNAPCRSAPSCSIARCATRRRRAEGKGGARSPASVALSAFRASV